MLTLLNRIYNALCYSITGLKIAFRFEWAFRLEAFISIIAVPSAFYLGHTATQRALLLGAVFLVLIIELINTAIETVVDRVSEEHHELSGRAKDIGSSAVLLAVINAIIIWLLIGFSHG